MKRFLLLLLTIISVFYTQAQDITGDWYGAIEIQGRQLPLVFHITKSENRYITIMDSPAQQAEGIPVEATTYNFPNLLVEMPNLQFVYSGEVNNDFTKIIGNVTQYGNKIDLDLQRQVVEVEKPSRPQEPSKPYPYHSEDITFENTAAGHSMAGTLTLPTMGNKHPVVILISGSGPQNRDEELMGHRPFLVLSDYLTRQGIGVLRYDDRGVGASKGDFSKATSADFATDVEAAIAYLKTRQDVDADQIGLIGHSEGGMIAPMVAADAANDVDFIVLLAGPGIPISKLMALQVNRIATVEGVSEKVMKVNRINTRKINRLLRKSLSDEDLRDKITRRLSIWYDKLPAEGREAFGDKDVFVQAQSSVLMSPWYRYFIRFNPADYLTKVTCPVLAINGAKDLQVTPVENIRGIEKALNKGDNRQFTTRILDDLNHLFQHAKSGSPEEYSRIEETFAPEAMEFISNWIIPLIE